MSPLKYLGIFALVRVGKAVGQIRKTTRGPIMSRKSFSSRPEKIERLGERFLATPKLQRK